MEIFPSPYYSILYLYTRLVFPSEKIQFQIQKLNRKYSKIFQRIRNHSIGTFGNMRNVLCITRLITHIGRIGIVMLSYFLVGRVRSIIINVITTALLDNNITYIRLIYPWGDRITIPFRRTYLQQPQLCFSHAVMVIIINGSKTWIIYIRTNMHEYIYIYI